VTLNNMYLMVQIVLLQ